MFILGLTGGIASGKSTVSRILKELGADIIDADKIAGNIVEPQKDAWKEIVAHFGEEILTKNKSIDRIRLGNIIFNDENEKKILESITHKYIKSEIEHCLSVLEEKRTEVIVLDIPLLFEVGWDKMADEVWVVYADEKNQLNRLIQRNNWSKEEAKARINSQMSLKEKVKRASFVIDNNKDIVYTKKQVSNRWRYLRDGLKGND